MYDDHNHANSNINVSNTNTTNTTSTTSTTNETKFLRPR